MRQGGLILAAGHVRCVRRKKTKKNTQNSAVPKTHHEIYSSPAIATTSRRRATKHVPRVRPYSPASIDPGFVEIGLVQLSQSAKRRMLQIHPDRHTDGQNNGTLSAPRYKEAFLSTGIKRPQSLRSLGLASLLVDRYMRQGGLILAATSCAFEKTNHAIPPHPKHTMKSMRATKHVPRVSLYSPASIDPGFVEIGLVQLSQSVKTTNVTHTLTDTQTDRQTDRQTDTD